MFEDSLVESTGRIRTRSRRYAVGSFLLEAALVAVIILVPYLYPAVLPTHYLSVPLIAPPPAPAPQMAQQRAAASLQRPVLLAIDMTAPRQIPNTIPHIVDDAPPSFVPGGDIGGNANSGPPGVLFSNSTGPSPAPRGRPAKPSGPIHISSGVAQGQLLAPIRPVYSAIAIAAHIQGTVVVAATISTAGNIENIHVLSGPAILVNSAVDAIRQARYRPYLLNGEPVEVETTISVVFRLDGGA
jgi:protein TonB